MGKIKLFLGGILLFLSVSCIARIENSEDTIILSRNYAYEDTSYFKDLDVFLGDRKDSLSFFCIGEMHDMEGNYYTNFDLFKYLNRRFGFNSILLEGGSVFTYYINEFLNSGDSGLYRVCVNMLFTQKNEMADYFHLLKRLNDDTVNSVKIKFYSIDPSCFTYPAITLIHEICKKHYNMPLILNKPINQLNKFEEVGLYGDRNIRKLTNSLWHSVNQYDTSWRDFLDKDFDLFQKVLSELYFSEITERNAPRELRENIMLSNFKKLVLQLPEAKFMLQMGANHTTIAPKYFNKKYLWESFLYKSILAGVVNRYELISLRLYTNRLNTEQTNQSLKSEVVIYPIYERKMLYDGEIINDIR